MTKKELAKLTREEKVELVLQRLGERLSDAKRSELVEELLERHAGETAPMGVYKMTVEQLDDELRGGGRIVSDPTNEWIPKKDQVVEIDEGGWATRCVVLSVGKRKVRVHSLDPKNPFRTTLHKSPYGWEEYAIGNVSGTIRYDVRLIEEAGS